MSLPANFNSCVNSGSISGDFFFLIIGYVFQCIFVCLVVLIVCSTFMIFYCIKWGVDLHPYKFLWPFSGTVIFLGNNLICLAVLKVLYMKPAERLVWLFLTAEKILPRVRCLMRSECLDVSQSDLCACCFHMPWPLLRLPRLRLSFHLVLSLSACLCPHILLLWGQQPYWIRAHHHDLILN